MLAGVLLHVIGPPGRIDAAMGWTRRERKVDNVKDRARRFVFQTVE
jgi:hypothetical protein